MGKFTVTEPHPTVVKNQFTHAGRGGAGNYFRAPATTPASGVPSETKSLPPQTRFFSGRGGAGNAHVASQRPVMSFEEEFVRQSHLEEKSVGHVGRGGAGNVYGSSTGSRKSSDASTHSSESSGSSIRSGFMHRLSSIASRH